jgi:hypothetical protein
MIGGFFIDEPTKFAHGRAVHRGRKWKRVQRKKVVAILAIAPANPLAKCFDVD